MLNYTIIFLTCLPIVLSFHHFFRLIRNSSEVLDDDYFPMSGDVQKKWDPEKQRFVVEDEINNITKGENKTTNHLMRKKITTYKGRFKAPKTTENQYMKRKFALENKLENFIWYPPNYDIIHRLTYLRVIPDIITIGPKEVCTVSYDRRQGKTIELGAGLGYSLVKRPPQIHWPVLKPYTFFTLFFTRLRTSIVHHSFDEYEQRHNWLICNIPGCETRRGQVLLRYDMTPTSQLQGGHYVYLMLVLKQDQKFHPKIPFTGERFLRNSTIVGRENFTVRDFIWENDLKDTAYAAFYYYVYF